MLDEEEFKESKAPKTRVSRLGKTQKSILMLLYDQGMAMTQGEITEFLRQEGWDVTSQSVRQSCMRMVERNDIPIERKDLGVNGIHYGITARSKVKKMLGHEYD